MSAADSRLYPGSVELLPCPFCGAPARDDLLPHAGGPGWVQCSACECDQHMSDTLEEAVARWNRRSGVPAQATPNLGDIVTMNQESPYFSDWRGIEMKIVSLRLAPDGKLWASVIERPYDQGYRGYGTYDGETTDIDVAYLSALSSACPEATPQTPDGRLMPMSDILRELNAEIKALRSTPSASAGPQAEAAWEALRDLWSRLGSNYPVSGGGLAIRTRNWLGGFPDIEALNDSLKRASKLLAQGSQEGTPSAAGVWFSSLIESLRPFAYYFDLNDCEGRSDGDALEIPVSDLRAARDLLKKLGIDTSLPPWAPSLPSTSRGTLEEAAQRLVDDLLAQHIPRDKFSVGIGDKELHAYVRPSRVNCRADIIDGWPVVWHFNVGPAVAFTSPHQNPAKD